MFEFYQPVKMKDDPLWIDVTELMKAGAAGLGGYVAIFASNPDLVNRVGEFAGKLSALLNVCDTDLHIDEVTGSDKTLDDNNSICLSLILTKVFSLKPSVINFLTNSFLFISFMFNFFFY